MMFILSKVLKDAAKVLEEVPEVFKEVLWLLKDPCGAPLRVLV